MTSPDPYPNPYPYWYPNPYSNPYPNPDPCPHAHRLTNSKNRLGSRSPKKTMSGLTKPAWCTCVCVYVCMVYVQISTHLHNVYLVVAIPQGLVTRQCGPS